MQTPAATSGSCVPCVPCVPCLGEQGDFPRIRPAVLLGLRPDFSFRKNPPRIAQERRIPKRTDGIRLSTVRTQEAGTEKALVSVLHPRQNAPCKGGYEENPPV